MVDISSVEAFWGSLRAGASKTVAEQGRPFLVMWVIWLYWNEVIFKGRTALTDRVVTQCGGFCFCLVQDGVNG